MEGLLGQVDLWAYLCGTVLVVNGSGQTQALWVAPLPRLEAEGCRVRVS